MAVIESERAGQRFPAEKRQQLQYDAPFIKKTRTEVKINARKNIPQMPPPSRESRTRGFINIKTTI